MTTTFHKPGVLIAYMKPCEICGSDVLVTGPDAFNVRCAQHSPLGESHWLRFDKGLSLDIDAALQPIREALDGFDELQQIDAQVASVKVRLLALAARAQRLHEAHNEPGSPCPMVDDLREAAAKL